MYHKSHTGCAGWLHALFPVIACPATAGVFAEKRKYVMRQRKKIHNKVPSISRSYISKVPFKNSSSMSVIIEKIDQVY